ncbi:hypothetical protein L3Q82_019875, partial [Scortum barcoo]
TFPMCTAVDSGDIIILSDDDEEDHELSCSEASVLIVEVEVEDVKKKNDSVLPPSSLDEDLVVTFSRRAEVLPHARYDCPIHPFTATDCETGAPADKNQLICDQCFCYICDKLASSCVMWIYSGVCHCNSHKRSNFWNNLRNSTLLGGLKTFNFTLSEMDAHLRHAEMMLQSFRQELSARFSSFLKGKTVEGFDLSRSNQKCLIFDYTSVYEFVSSFLNKADKQDGRAAAVMRLGAAEDFIRHCPVTGTFILQSPMANVAEAKVVLLQRVISSLQRQMVMSAFMPEFTQKLQDFYKRFHFPAELKSMRNSLCVRPWDDVLLVSVLKGQNVTGIRKDKGKRDVLFEQISVVLLRTEVLQRQHRYRELCRYLRVVQTDDSTLLQQVQDLVPFFMCMEGDFTSALQSLFPPVNAPASRFTPHLFLFYLRIFRTGTAPKLAVCRPVELCHTDAAWEPIKGVLPLTQVLLVKFALRVQRICPAVFTDSQCWTSLLTVVNTPHGSLTALPVPSPQFLLVFEVIFILHILSFLSALQEAKDVVNSILCEQGSNIQIPRFFQEVYPHQALLLLVTGALGLRILNAALRPALHVLNTFKDNVWAVEWLWDYLPPERLRSFLQEITQEVENTAGVWAPCLYNESVY